MKAVYNIGSEVIETVYTYEEWLKEYNRRKRLKAKRKIIQRTEHLYYMKQQLSGVIMATIGIVTPFVLDGDATFSLVALPLGLFLMMTREKVMTF